MRTITSRSLFATAALALALAAFTTAAPAQRGKKPAEIFTVDPATAGSVAGKVTLKGTAPDNVVIDMSGVQYCHDAHSEPVKTEFVVHNDKGEVKDTFIWISKGLEGKAFAPPTDPVVLDQIGCMYHPTVFGLQVGQKLEIRNSDSTLHNIHAIGEATKKDYFNLSMPNKGMTLTRDKDFNGPELMLKFKCEVHPWMFAWCGVVDHPYFATSDAEGNFSIGNLPPGSYTLSAWQRKGGTLTKDIVVPEGGAVEASFEFDFTAPAP